ncbi:hypothetical protein JOE65_001072 [Arthrobacter roseus]|nr:hypothetical protein [Arthrobacter roseus]
MRHRLNRHGDRQLNNALDVIAKPECDVMQKPGNTLNVVPPKA